MPKKIARLINPETIADGFTQSEINTLAECGYKWLLSYNHRVKGVEYEPNFLIGTAWHGFQESYWKTLGKSWVVPRLSQDPDAVIPQDQEAYMDLWDEKLRVLAEAYTKFYADDFDIAGDDIFAVEEEADVTVELDGIPIRLRGKLDLIKQKKLKKKKQIWDHKTAQDIDGIGQRAWEFRFQFMFYLWLQHQAMPDDKAMEFVVNVVRKPSIRLKQAETIPQYVNRLRNDVNADPTKYFGRETLLLTAGRMDRFEREVLSTKLTKLKLICDPDTDNEILRSIVLDKNTSSCYNIHGKWCPFIEHCDKGKEIRTFHQREHKHPELGPA